jgi:uncharacterized membrane protein (GlpM family)
MSQWVIRFLVGGAIVSLFALLGDLLHPIFGGLFLVFPAIFSGKRYAVGKARTRQEA